MIHARDRFLTANRLKLHLLEWGDAGPVVVLLHGFLEHAHVWDWVAPRLAAAGFHAFALDWRGHGDSEWVGPGGYYHFLDYVADLSELRRQLGDRINLVAHSMGGGAALLYAGTEPQHVGALVSIEGLGMPDSDPRDVPQRGAAWRADRRRAGTGRRPPLAFADAVAKLRERNPRFTDAIAHHMVEHGSRAAGDGRQWKFDPLHQTRSPQPTYVAQARAFWSRVSCRVLYVEGSETGLRLPAADLEERLTILRAQRVVVPESGHHPHLEQPEALAGILIDFLQRAT